MLADDLRRRRWSAPGPFWSAPAPLRDVYKRQGEWDTTVAVNLKGVFLCGREAARRMVQRHDGGVIVNIASMAGKQGRVPWQAHYIASKFGVVGLTQAMA